MQRRKNYEINKNWTFCGIHHFMPFYKLHKKECKKEKSNLFE